MVTVLAVLLSFHYSFEGTQQTQLLCSESLLGESLEYAPENICKAAIQCYTFEFSRAFFTAPTTGVFIFLWRVKMLHLLHHSLPCRAWAQRNTDGTNGSFIVQTMWSFTLAGWKVEQAIIYYENEDIWMVLKPKNTDYLFVRTNLIKRYPGPHSGIERVVKCFASTYPSCQHLEERVSCQHGQTLFVTDERKVLRGHREPTDLLAIRKRTRMFKKENAILSLPSSVSSNIPQPLDLRKSSLKIKTNKILPWV